MAGVEFGAALPSARNIPEFAQKAESCGYDYLVCGEHMMFHGPVANALAVAAGATTKIKLMSTVVLLPLYTPMVVAKQASVLDVASEGRYHLGIGIGGEFPKEFEACGVPVNQRGSRTNEALEVIKKLWTEDKVTFEGRYSKFSGVTLEPKPAQKPHPPIWVAGRKEPAMRRAATYADGWIPYMYTPEMLHESLEKIHQLASFARGFSCLRRSIRIATKRASRRRRRSVRTTRRISRKSRDGTRSMGIPRTAVSGSRNISTPAHVRCW